VKVTHYLRDPRHYATHTELRTKIFGRDAPASELMYVKGLAFPEALVEIEAIAYVGRDTRVFHWPGDTSRPSGYSPAVRAGNLLFTAGQAGIDKKSQVVGPGDPKAQIKVALDNVEDLLKLAGAFTRDVIKTSNFLTSPLFVPTFQEARARCFPQEPCSTTVIVPELGLPEVMEATETIATVKGRAEFLNLPGVNRPPGFSQAVQVGDLIFTSGLVARSRAGRVVGKGSVKLQMENIFTNLRQVLGLAGAALKDVIKVNVYLASPMYFDAWREVGGRHLGGPTPPASTTVAVSSMVSPEYLAELEAVAASP
jgi:enamine deaminase RidA (YjgF/YER057c/UK114 family)